jgi:uncharacterized protein (UPF0548 family)
MYQNSTKFVLVGTGKPDEQYLEQWRDAPLTYQRGQKIDASWHTDHNEYVFGGKGLSYEELFKRAADLILRYEFYPPSLMIHISDFSRENRRMRVGDRVVQRIRSSVRVIEALTINEVVEVIDRPSRAGFTYVTTAAHSEMGEFSVLVERRSDQLKVTLHTISRTRPEFPFFLRGYARRLQKSAHKRVILYFTQRVLEDQS